MAGSTTNYGATKPAVGEAYDINVHNNNNDIWDAQIKNRENQAKGVVAHTSDGTTSTGLAGTAVMCNLVAVSMIVNRWYKIHYVIKVVTTVADMAILANFKKSGTSDSTNTGTQLGYDNTLYTAPVANQGQTIEYITYYKAVATETVNVKAILARATTTASYDISQRQLTVEDMGFQI